VDLSSTKYGGLSKAKLALGTTPMETYSMQNKFSTIIRPERSNLMDPSGKNARNEEANSGNPSKYFNITPEKK
jgi:hypothetical protein